ncbi:MAG: peptide chain release factor N(5)-glutamine methyltransferase [Candidatus Obscuribacterales bacterium]|nr:peptide chain release factor N(5)-glutamine methyltransferase [Candidatus Obscuribacterales bacterium]
MVRTIRECAQSLRSALRTLGVDDGEAEAECDLIVEHVTGLRRSQRLLYPDSAVTAEQELQLSAVMRRRADGEAVQYCLGEAWFMNHRFAVRPGVFIPRSDTEVLVETVLHRLKGVYSPAIAEVGTGSGAIAVSLLAARPDAKVSAAELSPMAYETTLENAVNCGVADRLTLTNADWLEWLPSLPPGLDVFVSNPPYIPRRQQAELAREVLAEPHLALFGSDEDGLGFYRQFAQVVREKLKPQGFIAVETGDGQADAVAEIFARARWVDPATERDLTGNKRVVTASPGNLGAFKAS